VWRTSSLVTGVKSGGGLVCEVGSPSAREVQVGGWGKEGGSEGLTFVVEVVLMV
jgi:hypothetical protein